ncbi:MAG TPA: hypothetical protein VFP97_06410 [Chitinophagaceae bacterium]|nr:hypothetical protein [Chitinophagaceae bacterium]
MGIGDDFYFVVCMGFLHIVSSHQKKELKQGWMTFARVDSIKGFRPPEGFPGTHNWMKRAASAEFNYNEWCSHIWSVFP